MIRTLTSVLFVFLIGHSNAQGWFDEHDNADLSSLFVLPEKTSDEILQNQYADLGRGDRLEIKNTIIHGSRLSLRLNRSSQIILSSKAGDYLNDLKHKILAHYPVADSMIELFIADDASLNAFATVDNKIYVNVGLLARVENEGQLVFILCHEIMHIVNEHIVGETVSREEKARSVEKDEIGVKDEFSELNRHAQSKLDEFEADFDGFGLFKLLGEYSLMDAYQALELLYEAENSILETPNEAGIYFVDSELFEKMTEFRIKTFTKADTQETLTELSTHPSIAERLMVLDGMFAVDTNYVSTSTNPAFDAIRLAALDRISAIYAGKMDFFSLFLHSSTKFYRGDRSNENLRNLAYAIQGIYIDKMRGYDAKNSFCLTYADSVITSFYIQAEPEEIYRWAYRSLSNLSKDHPIVTDYLFSFYTNLDKTVDDLKFAEIVQDEVEFSRFAQDSTILLVSDIDFSVAPTVDLTFRQTLQYNDRRNSGKYESGKIAYVNTTSFRIREGGRMSSGFVFDGLKSDQLDQNARNAFMGFAERDPLILSYLPQPESYTGGEYTNYKLLNTWASEMMAFEGYSYQSYVQSEIDALMAKEDLRYVASNLNVEVKTGSFLSFFKLYFAPFVLPIYAPMLALSAVADGVRSFMLTVVIDLKTRELVYWDRRTTNEPSTEAYLYQVSYDIVRKFTRKK